MKCLKAVTSAQNPSRATNFFLIQAAHQSLLELSPGKNSVLSVRMEGSHKLERAPKINLRATLALDLRCPRTFIFGPCIESGSSIHQASVVLETVGIHGPLSDLFGTFTGHTSISDHQSLDLSLGVDSNIMAPTTASQPVADTPVDASQAKHKKDKSKKNKKGTDDAAATVADDADADAVAEQLDGSPVDESDAAKKERKRQKKERKERERLEREQAEKDAATVAAASAAQAVNAVASATRLPIDPSLVPSSASEANTADAQDPVPAATNNAEAPAPVVADQKPSAPPSFGAEIASAAMTAQNQQVAAATAGAGEQPVKRKRGRPRKDGSSGPPAPKKPKNDDGEKRTRRPKMSEEAMFEELKGLPKRELLVERVYSSDMLAKLERTIGLKYAKGRFTTQEQDTIKKGIAEFMKHKGLSEEDFQELLYNYREKGWERMYTELWKDLAGRLEDRPNIAVRLHVRTNKSQFRRQGRYTLAEDYEIKRRMGELREDAASVAKRLGRLNQDVLSRFVKLQVKEEMEQGEPWTIEEDKAVLAALEKFKQERPGEVISWKEIAKMVGNKRSYKVYSNLFSNIRSRVDRSGAQPRRDYGTMGDAGDTSDQAVRGNHRHPTRAEFDNSVWIPGEDDLILLQRLNFQDVLSEEKVRWDELSFEAWQWPAEELKEQFAMIKSRYLGDAWTGGWQEALDKIIRTIRTRRTKKEIDDEGEDAKDVRMAEDETQVEGESEAGPSKSAAPVAPEPAADVPAAAIDPALSTEAAATEAAAAAPAIATT